MTDSIPADLFAAAGMTLEPTPPRKPKRQAKRQRKPTPSERAAAARALGARGPVCPWDDGARVRIGEPRVFHKPRVVGFLFSRNAQLVEETKQQLPDLYSRDYEKIRAKIHRSISQKFTRRGIPNDDASWCAHELIHAAFNIKMAETRREMGTR